MRIAVDVDSTRPDTVLELRVTTKEDLGAFLIFPWRNRESTWEEACVTPCRPDFDRFSSYRVNAQNGSGVVLLGIGVPLTIGTETHVTNDAGHELTFLPRMIKLPGGLTLTQKGIVF